MMKPERTTHPTKAAPRVAIACGGTGGHLFPGIAVAEDLARRGCAVTLFISPKEVDQEAVRALGGFAVITLPAAGLTRGGRIRFWRGFIGSFLAARKHFIARPPDAVLGMGGFTSFPPVLAGRLRGAKTFFHESNFIPGRANRRLVSLVDEAFVHFQETSGYLNLQKVSATGMPLRCAFREPVDPGAARVSLGLNPDAPVLLVMGGSQGASAINHLVIKALPHLVRGLPDLQFIHLTGANDLQKARAVYAAENRKAVVRAFLTEMELALGAATVAISRSGASSLAEIAAMRLPSIFIPYPSAVDNHQFYNATAFVETGAAKLLEQSAATPESLARMVIELVRNDEPRHAMRDSLAQWGSPDAAARIAERILTVSEITLAPGSESAGAHCVRAATKPPALTTSDPA